MARLELPNGDNIPTSVDTVAPGDWVASRQTWGSMAMGQVIERAYHPKLGPGFVVRTIGGRLDFLAEADTVILGYRDSAPPDAA